VSGLTFNLITSWLSEAGWLAGEPRSIGTPVDEAIEGACIDSRLASVGCVFVALAGERTDGHRHVDDAVSRGAVAAIVSADKLQEVSEEVYGSVLLIPVEDPLAALQCVGRRWREGFPGLVRIAVTGSNGKTTTKDLIASILSASGSTIASRGNYNSDIGMPVELLRIRGYHNFGVFEAGMNRPGEISELAALLQPDVALITNVGSAHVGMIGTRRGIAEEKKSIFSLFDGSQTAVIPSSGAYSQLLGDGVNGTVVAYGPASAGLRGIGEITATGTILRLLEGDVSLGLPGRHMVQNALAAITVARILDMPFEAIRSGIEAMKPVFGRSEVVRGRVTVIQDCYNANPESMDSALDLLLSVGRNSRRIAILGAMKELGEESEELHRNLFVQATESDIDELWFVGAEFSSFRDSTDRRIRWFDDGQWRGLEVAAREIEDGATVLVKGSRLMELERLTPVIQGQPVAGGAHG